MGKVKRAKEGREAEIRVERKKERKKERKREREREKDPKRSHVREQKKINRAVEGRGKRASHAR